MKRFLFLFFLLPGIAAAATATVTWSNPTTAIDGSPLTGAQALTSTQIFLATSPIADTSTMVPTATVTSGTSTTQTIAASVGQTIYVRVKSCNQWGCSAFSNQGSKVVPGSIPGMPTSVTITIELS